MRITIGPARERTSPMSWQESTILSPDENPACPCCGGYKLRVLGKLPDSLWFAGRPLTQALPGGRLYRCHICGLKFRHPVQSVATYQKLYNNDAIEIWPADRHRADWKLITSQIRKLRPEGARVLDFGCYSGGLLAELESKYQRYGIEINDAAAYVASEKNQTRIWRSIEDIPAGQHFDVIVASDVVEHVRNPEMLLNQLSNLLTENGILIITTGDADNRIWSCLGANWWYCFYPEHIAFISRTWLKYYSKKNRLSVKHSETFRYLRLCSPRYVLDILFVYFYGFFPTAYLRLVNSLKKILGRPSATSVAGAGVSADHLLVVLTPKAEA